MTALLGVEAGRIAPLSATSERVTRALPYRRAVVCGDAVGRWRSAFGLQVSLDRRMPVGDCQSWLLQSEPVLCSQPPRAQELAAGLADGFKDHCKI